MATSPSEEILRLRRIDKGSEQQSDHFLVRVTQRGPDALDLQLVGTDREDIFRAKIKESALASLQAGNFSGDLAEWKSIISYALLHQRPEGPLPENLQRIETVAQLDRSTVTIIIRNNVSGITQRLGSIQLGKDTEYETNVLDWADVAAKTSDDLRSKLDGLQASLVTQQDRIIQLSAQLDNLVRAKKEHEDELLSKFAALLNAKKLKIRDQQRLLAGAQIDPDAAENARRERSESLQPAGRGVAASRKGKRKATEAPAPAVLEDEEAQNNDDDETDPGTLDADEDGRRQQLTPETETEDEDGAEADANEAPDVNPDDSQTTRRVATGQRQRTSNRMEVDDSQTQVSLPVGRRRGEPAKEPTPPPTSTANDNDDDDETDDEL